MVTLGMRRIGYIRSAAGHSNWRVGSADGKNVTFPSTERIAEIWRLHAPGLNSDLKLHNRFDNCVLVEIAAGTKPKARQSFLDSLSKEVEYA